MKKETLYRFQDRIFTAIVRLSYVLIVLTSFGIYNINPEYLTSLNYYINVYVCLFLIWRFNPFRTINEFTKLDKKIAFSAGMFILTTTLLNQYMNSIKGFLSQIPQLLFQS